MAAMNEFLLHLQTPVAASLYCDLDRVWDERARKLNSLLAAETLPVEIVNMSSIWTVCYTRPSRYNWMFQYYLRVEGLALSWIGTGRLIFGLDYTDTDFAAVAERFIAAARAMQQDGWWWNNTRLTDRSIKRTILREMIVRRLLPEPVQREH
jgi:glutamate-1-semialdehyde 2,1-aminomutase